jgi:hypothetical protein
VSEVAFLIVGSPRSGTTVLQRLAGDLAGVAVPFETHFFTKGVPIVERHGGFPVAPDRLGPVLDDYLAIDALAGSGLSGASVIDRLATDAPDALELFDAVVSAATGGAPILGEKTPGHVRWASRLARLRPGLRVVGIVRDPRAVAASQREMPWTGGRVGLSAERWRSDQRALLRLDEELGDRFLLVRYEAMVVDPDGTRAALAALLRTEIATDADPAPPAVLAWETWKGRSGEEVTDASVERWRDSLSPVEVAQVVAAAEPVASQLGYRLGSPGVADRLRVRCDLTTRRRREQIRARRAEQDAAIEGAVLG